MPPSLPSLLMALLGPPPLYQYLPAADEPDPALGSEVIDWMGTSKERKELMLQALYGALPYAFKDEQAARAVGRLLAKAVGGADRAPAEADLQALRKEVREELRIRFNKIRDDIAKS